jgi:putative transposase
MGSGPGRLEPIAPKKKARAATPSYGIIDSQSTKTQYASEERGIDGGKWVKGRKRHIVVDILGDVLHVQVHAANVPDTKAGCAVLQRTAENYSSLQAFCGDAGYRGTEEDRYWREDMEESEE